MTREHPPKCGHRSVDRPEIGRLCSGFEFLRSNFARPTPADAPVITTTSGTSFRPNLFPFYFPGKKLIKMSLMRSAKWAKTYAGEWVHVKDTSDDSSKTIIVDTITRAHSAAYPASGGSR
jgi:hypothetical protein